jgi:hypothetical protein
MGSVFVETDVLQTLLYASRENAYFSPEIFLTKMTKASSTFFFFFFWR